MAIATALRLWGIGLGLPYTCVPDEPGYVTVALKMLHTGDLNPHWFQVPSLSFYVALGAYLVYFTYGALGGAFTGPMDIALPEGIFLGGGLAGDPAGLLWVRTFWALLGTLTVLVSYLVGKRCYNQRVGVVAALLVAVSPTHATLLFHGVSLDIPMLFLLLLSVYFGYRAFLFGHRRDYLSAGLLVGLASSSKYTGLVGLVPLAMAVIFSRGRKEHLHGMLIGLVAIGLGFVLGTPFAVLSPKEFGSQFAAEFAHYSGGHAGAEGDSWLWYIEYLLIDSEGPMVILALAGMLWGLCSRDKRNLLIASCPVAYYFAMSRFEVHFARTAAPFVPFLALLAARAIDDTFESWARHWSKFLPFKNLAYGLAVLLVTIFPIYKTVATDSLLSQVDVRTLARKWIEENVPLGSKIAFEAYSPTLVDLSYELAYFPAAIEHDPQWYLAERFDFLVASSGMYGRFFSQPGRYASQVRGYQALFEAFPLVKEITGPFMGSRGGAIRVYRVTAP